MQDNISDRRTRNSGIHNSPRRPMRTVNAFYRVSEDYSTQVEGNCNARRAEIMNDAVTQFVWTFPCFVLACEDQWGTIDCERNPEGKTSLAAPDGNLAVFTDRHLAEEFRDNHSGATLELIELDSAEIVAEFLYVVSNCFDAIAVDPNPKTGFGWVFSVEATAALLGGQDFH